jgi:hypothetical protein
MAKVKQLKFVNNKATAVVVWLGIVSLVVLLSVRGHQPLRLCIENGEPQQTLPQLENQWGEPSSRNSGVAEWTSGPYRWARYNQRTGNVHSIGGQSLSLSDGRRLSVGTLLLRVAWDLRGLRRLEASPGEYRFIDEGNNVLRVVPTSNQGIFSLARVASFEISEMGSGEFLDEAGKAYVQKQAENRR